MKTKAFTLAQLMLTFLIIGIIASITIKIVDVKKTYINKFLYYSAFTNFKLSVAELLADNRSLLTSTTTGAGFCGNLINVFNTVGRADNTTCTYTATSGFDSANPNFITTNGMRFYNFGGNPTPPYTVYVDIDGKSRNGILNEDVMQFNIYEDGTVLPSPSSIGATSNEYLSAAVRYPDTPHSYHLVAKSVPYFDAVCIAKGEYTGATCPAEALLLYNSNCSNHDCLVVINKPGNLWYSF